MSHRDAPVSGQPPVWPKAVPPSVAAPITAKAQLNDRYTFDRFIVGDENRLAHAAAQAVAGKPGSLYNPLSIRGGTGLGKTHLLHAIGHCASANHYRVLYVTAERFTKEFVAAIQNVSTHELRARYRRVDVLLIDDIQFLAGKSSSVVAAHPGFSSPWSAPWSPDSSGD